MSASLVAVDDQNAQLKGALDHHSGAELLQQGQRLLDKAGSNWHVDLSEVTHSSSVGVALLLGWKRYATKNNTSLVLKSVPENMRHVMEFSGLQGIFAPD